MLHITSDHFPSKKKKKKQWLIPQQDFIIPKYQRKTAEIDDNFHHSNFDFA